jgi:hypothetical protein
MCDLGMKAQEALLLTPYQAYRRFPSFFHGFWAACFSRPFLSMTCLESLDTLLRVRPICAVQIHFQTLSVLVAAVCMDLVP